MGKSTISMVIFHSYVSLPEGKHHGNTRLRGDSAKQTHGGDDHRHEDIRRPKSLVMFR